MIPYQNGGKYIRPIALFQAQPKGKEDATTFEKLRAELMNTGIPAEHIAIRTADVNELKNVDLLSPDCPVRYIITVNALKEGWDCPFAYILASLANKTSQVDGSDLRAYVNLIVDGMDREQLAAMAKPRWALPQKSELKSRLCWISTTRRPSSPGLTGAKSCVNPITACLRQSTP